jgi:hypothetical protein
MASHHSSTILQKQHRCGTGFYDEFIMGHDPIVPPSVFDIAFEEYAERTVAPEAVESAVDFGRLEQKASAFAQGTLSNHVHS